MNEIERPSHRLSVRNEQVETVQAVTMVGIESPRHNTVDGQRRDSEWNVSASGSDRSLHYRFVIGYVDANAQYTSFASVDQGTDGAVIAR